MTRRERQRRRKRHRNGGSSRVAFLVLGIVTATVAIAALSVAGWVIGMMASAPDLTTIKPVEQGQSSVVYAADGQRLGFITADTLRTPIPREAIPTNIRNATVAIEDRRFYSHKGVDVEGVFRAAMKNLSSRRRVEGGSTLTMQLIKNLYDPGKQRTFTRKVREAKLAQELESEHPGIDGKRWILDRYLNSVPYGTMGGQTAVGIQAASRMYFGKAASRLTLPEAALLAGLPQAPSLYNPFRDEKRALQRRNEVLRAMARGGYITDETAQEAMDSPLQVRDSRYYTERRESYFFDYVKDQLIKRYGLAKVRKGGLRVYTTIDLRLQKLARQAIANRLADPAPPAAALAGRPPAPRPAGGGAGDHPPPQRPHPRDGLVPEVRKLDVQPRGAGQAPAGIDVQGHGADGRAASGRRPQGDDVHVQAPALQGPAVGADRRPDRRPRLPR